MPDFKDRMADYVPVNERIEAFKADWPDGSLQSSIVELTASRVTVKAYAYRTPDDQRPGIGHSSLEIPGATPYTKGSEIENAETSAWGRAIAALGFEVKRGIASREEATNKQSGQGEREQPNGRRVGATTPAPAQTSKQRSAEEMGLLDELLAIPGMTKARLSMLADSAGVPKGERATADQLREMLALTTIGLPEPSRAPHGSGEPAVPPADEAGEGSSDSPPPPTEEEILAAAGEGAEIVPPAPGSDEYKALPPAQRAHAKAWHTRGGPAHEQETLAEVMGAPPAND